MSDTDGSVDLPAEFGDSVRRYVDASREIAQDAQRRSREAELEYSRAVFEIQQQSQQATAGDFQEAIRAFQSSAQETQQRWQEATRAYWEAVQVVAKESAQRQEEAFREYLASLQRAWAHVDPATIDGPGLVAIQQAMVAAAFTPRAAAR